MSKTDTKQEKLTFEGKKLIRNTEGEKSYGATMNPQTAEELELDLKEILLVIKTSLRTIDNKLDLLTARLYEVKQRVNTRESRLDVLENRISEIDDQQYKSKEHNFKHGQDATHHQGQEQRSGG
ncbi:hypothetical protein NDU88_003639 [Pleurodeles waltl]|uniref:Uncharacterized protein n=1 Tax=Pleurodeles waltl TaxID=8319 RepID=A0AAV7T5X9_PLEWA|nr:hypothetical protein NDU88_003639 [Pleurodeles waltl]